MPNYFNPYYQNYPQNNYPQAQQNQPVQNGGFISVPSEDIVKTYPVAPGNCVTFKIEGQPIVMEKSMGFSQFDSPKVERYRLIKEERIEQAKEEPNELEEVWSEIRTLKKEIETLKSRKVTPKKKEVDDDTD